MQKISVREYGFFMAIFFPLLIGVCAVVSNELQGSLSAAIVVAWVALCFGSLQLVVEAFIVDDTHHYRGKYFTADQMVNYNILTAVFTTFVSTMVAVWMISLSISLFIPLLVLTPLAVSGACTWVGRRRMKIDPHPVHEAFRAIIWATPVVTGMFLLLSFYDFKSWFAIFYFIALLLGVGYLGLQVGSGTKAPATKTYHPTARKPEHVIRSEAGQ